MKPLRSSIAAVLTAAIGACTPALGRRPSPSTADSATVRRDIYYLASDALEGRLAGTPGNDSAAAYIARRYRSLGLLPLAPGFQQHFDARSVEDAHVGRTEPRATQNVIALLRGSDPILRKEYIVIGAHFDHLGRSKTFAMDPEAGDAIRNGADDNASGTAAVLDIARLLKRHPPRRSVIFANFSAEELGLLGSHWFVEHPLVPLDSVVAMINFDMVGRLRDDKLIVYGTGTATRLKEIVDSVNAALVVPFARLNDVGDGFGPSDQTSFYEKGIPVLHFFTDLHDDYHRATDDADKVNFEGEARVVDLATAVTTAIANAPVRLQLVRVATPPSGMTTREGSQVYLGSVPDMAGNEVVGLRLTGVRPGSPAEQGGLKAGDVIVEFGGAKVTDIYSYTNALYSHKPGDAVKVVVLRGTDRVEVTVTLGRRGG